MSVCTSLIYEIVILLHVFWEQKGIFMAAFVWRIDVLRGGDIAKYDYSYRWW